MTFASLGVTVGSYMYGVNLEPVCNEFVNVDQLWATLSQFGLVCGGMFGSIWNHSGINLDIQEPLAR